MNQIDYNKIRENISTTYQIAKSRNWFIKSDLIIDRKATDEEINSLEHSIGKKLPTQLADLLTKMSKSVNLYYQIEEDMPSEFGQIFSGELWFNLQQIENSNLEFSEWITASLDEDVNDIESIEITKKIKNNKTVLFEVSNGDLIAIDDETNEIVYFDHEGDTMHGKPLSKDLNTFLEQWSTMGFFGIESWQFEEMYDFKNNRLKNSTDKKVINWINWLNKNSDNIS